MRNLTGGARFQDTLSPYPDDVVMGAVRRQRVFGYMGRRYACRPHSAGQLPPLDAALVQVDI